MTKISNLAEFSKVGKKNYSWQKCQIWQKYKFECQIWKNVNFYSCVTPSHPQKIEVKIKLMDHPRKFKVKIKFTDHPRKVKSVNFPGLDSVRLGLETPDASAKVKFSQFRCNDKAADINRKKLIFFGWFLTLCTSSSFREGVRKPPQKNWIISLAQVR